MSLRLAPLPSVDLALLVQQGEILERAQLMVELGGIDLDDLLIRAHEYCVIADGGRLALCIDTKVKLHRNYADLAAKVSAWRDVQKQLAQDLDGERK